MSQFAKLFERDRVQVLVKLDSSTEDDTGAEIRFYFKPEGLGVCSLAHGFVDTDAGWDKAESLFERIDEEAAFAAIKDAMQIANEMTKEENND